MEELLLRLKKLDVLISVENNNLKLNIPDEVDESLFLKDVRARKHELIDYIESRTGRSVLYKSISKSSIKSDVRLTPSQSRMYVLSELSKNSIVYNIPIAAEISGVLNLKDFENALVQLINRHDSLRTYFVLNDEYQPVQNIEREVEFKLEIKKCDNDNGKLAEMIQDFLRPFDLAIAPLMRVCLIQKTENSYLLLADIHHIISDGTSFQIFIQELFALYSGISLSPTPLQYIDYTAWYFSNEYQDYLINQKEFWLKELDGYCNSAVLPMDFMRPNEISFEGEQVNYKFSQKRKKIIDRLKLIGDNSTFSVLLSLFAILQSKLTGINDLVIGTPVAGRIHNDLKGIIGMFVNTLGMRIMTKPNVAFSHFLNEVGEKVVKCLDHQEYPYESLLDDLELSHTNEVNPLFNTMIVLNNITDKELTFKNLEVKPYEVKKSTSKFDLIMHFHEIKNELRCSFEYSTKLFKKTTINLFFDYYNNIIDQLGDNHNLELNKISLLDKTGIRKLLKLNDFTDVKYPDTMTLVTMFEAQVLKTPENIAIQFEGDTMTYSELNCKSNQIAHLLKNNGVERGDVIGLLTGKSFDTVIGMIGILKAGGAYLPVDVTYPQKRISYTLECSKTQFVLSLKKFIHLIENRQISIICMEDASRMVDVTNPKPVNDPFDLCYVLYTSGTTGNPKGVMIEHKNVIRLLFNDEFQYDFCEEDVWTMFHSHCFDVSVWEMYGALLYGGRIIIISPTIARDPNEYLKILHQNNVTILNQTPTAFYNLAGAANKADVLLPKIRYVVFAGEALSPAKLQDWHEKHPNAKLLNMYGITEVTVHMTYKEIGAYEIENGVSNIGRPLPTGSMYLLDDYLQPVPPGVIGEIYVGGFGVGRGYLHNDDLTNQRFIKSPFNENDRIYKSGDLAILLENGDLEYKGRSDHQVQLRGFRIELGEVENQLLKHDSIENVVVLDKRNSTDDQPYLCAYFVAKVELTTLMLRDYLAKTLPFYMIPAYFMQITKVPYTSNNKVDKSKLPAPRSVELNEYLAPQTTAHKLIAPIWKNVLSIGKIGIKDNFFVLGGDSLKAIRLIAEINEKLESSLSIADLYENQTIEELCHNLRNDKSELNDAYSKQAEKNLLNFEREYKAKGIFLDTYEAVYPMNGVEIGMVFHSMKEHTNEKNKHNIIYHEQNLYPLPTTNFDFDTFVKALSLLVDKHSALRKIYDPENLAHIILKDAEPELNYIDISHLLRSEQKKYIEEKKAQEILKETSLSFSLIWRMNIIKVSNSQHYLLFDFHHSLFGGWSLNSFTTELNNVYFELLKDKVYKPSPLRSTYKDHILGEIVASLDEENINYWKDELNGYSRLELVDTHLKHEYRIDSYNMGEGLRQDLEELASKYQTSFKHLCFAAYVYTLKMFSYTNDITLGIVSNNRPLTLDGDKLLGCFLNTIPFRAIIPRDNTWGDYINYIENKLRKFKKHERVPFYKILEFINEPANQGNPIFDTSFNYIDFHILNEMVYEESAMELEDGVTGFDNYVNSNTLFDLHVSASDNKFNVWLTYSTTIMDSVLSQRVYQYFKAVLNKFLQNESERVSHNDILDEDQKRRIIEFNNTDSKSLNTDKTITTWFLEQVAKTPNAVAVTFEDEELSYSELDAKSNQLAKGLLGLGIRSHSVIGIMQYRSPNLIISILAILKLECAYLPIDYKYPEARIETMITDSEMSLLLTDVYTNDLITSQITKFQVSKDIYIDYDDSKLEAQGSDNDLLYVLYTSGSTGKPKGVMMSHRNLVNLMDYHVTSAKINSSSILQYTPIVFDVSFQEIFSALLTGGTLHLLSEEDSSNFTAILCKIQDKRIDTIYMPSSVLNQMFNSTFYQDDLPNTLTNIVSAGEQVVIGKLFKEYLVKHKIHFHNHYGPAETHVVTTHEVLPTKDLPEMPHIGFPVQNTQIHILNEDGHIQPIGVAGEICIGGAQVGLGYLNREGLTKDRFVENPFNKSIIYKTGDLGSWNNDGSITFYGRKDFQVKLNGVRVELKEIEHNLNEIPAISDSKVLLKEVSNNKLLVAYYTANEELPVISIQDFLQKSLPFNMIPHIYVHLENFPKTATGKLDRRALPDVEGVKLPYEEAANETEEVLLEMWSELLGLDPVSISVVQTFFNLGGNSLKAITLINLISREFSIEVSLNDLFTKQSIRAISDYILTIKQLEDVEEIDIVNAKIMI